MLDLFGELDVLTMPRFREVLDAVVATKPRHVVFDLSSTEFVSGAGYDAIGRCSYQVDRVSVCSTTGLAGKILHGSRIRACSVIQRLV